MVEFQDARDEWMEVDEAMEVRSTVAENIFSSRNQNILQKE